MVVIRIQEQVVDEQQRNAVLRLDQRTEYPLRIQDPFAGDPKQEANLEWYFEEYLTFPFTQDVRAKNAAESIQRYGETLFAQVFADPGALAIYKQARQQGLHTLQIEIVGSSAFQRLHWEALYDPEMETYLSLHASLVRQNIVPQTMPATMQPGPTINVLVVVARPGGSRDVGYRTISRPLMDELERTKLPVEVTLLRPGTYQALSTHLEQATRAYGVGHYHLIHFDVHGSLLAHAELAKGAQANRYLYASRFGRPKLETYPGEKAFLFLEGAEEEQFDPVEAGELAKLLRQYQIPLVLLNACQSGKLSGEVETSLGNKLVEAGVQAVVAMGYSVTVSAAEVLMSRLYQALFEKKPLPEALCLARQALADCKERRVYFNQRIDLEDWLLPILYQDRNVAFALRPFTPEEETAFYQGRAARYRPAQQPSYGFVGRDLDILHIEKRLLTKLNLLLIRGMGGAGKTTLLHHLASWWQRTGLVQEVFYFGYDERAWNRQQIMHTIARKLLDKYELLTFQSLSLDAQQVKLAQLLKSTRYLLILDNLESITGSKLAIHHTLSRKEQEALRLLLADLVGGQTLGLLGSRSAEKWLAKGTFEENRYDLGGLDQEAASQLTERIMERQGTTKYRSDPDLLKLLKLLDGFPLALEVVLANLAYQAPAEGLAALQAGDTALQVGTSEKRTENILRCVEYSYSNLSPDAQQLLLCLAPFTSVIWQNMFGHYVEHLKLQPVLATLPFEKWDTIIWETKNWGLLGVDQDMPSFLRIQPVFPYFLRHRLTSGEDLSNLRTAIETAFYDYYSKLSGSLFSLVQSKEATEREFGLPIIHYEYENILAALRLALSENTSVLTLYGTLNSYLEQRQDHRRGKELGLLVLSALEELSLEEMTSFRVAEWLGVLGEVATRQQQLREYEAAKESYFKLLKMLSSSKLDEKLGWLLQANTYHGLGNVVQDQRQWEQAEQYYQQALQIYIEYQDRYKQARIYYQLGMVIQAQRQWEQAEQYYQQALQIYIEYQDRYEQANIYHHLGVLVQEQQQWEQAEQYYQQALQIYIEYQDRYKQANSYNQLGIVAHEQEQWEQAEQYYQQALQIYIEYQDRYEQANIYHNLGVVTQERQQWKQAEQHYQQALQIKIEYQDRYEQASTYHQLGVLTYKQGQWEQAKQHYQQALQIYIEYQDRYKQAGTYNNLGILAYKQGQWEQAKQHYQQALQIYIEYQDRYEQANMYHHLGVLAQEQHQWEQAENYYQQALQISIERQDRYEQAGTYHNLGSMAQEQRQWEQAERQFLEALGIFVQYEDAHSASIVLRSLARLWQERKETALVERVASLIGGTSEETVALFQRLVEPAEEQGEE